MRNIWLLFKKEILAGLRDRRTAILVLVFPLIFYPMMLGLIFHFTSQNVSDGRGTVSRVIYQNRADSETLAGFFERNEDILTSFYEERSEARRAFDSGQGDV